MSIPAGTNHAAPPDTAAGDPPAPGGRTANGLEVEWLPGQGQQRHPLTSLFLASLASQYGERITATVAGELGLNDGTGSLPAETTGQAVRMAETQMDVFGGANFFIELHCSAAAAGAGFIGACRRAGVAPAALDAETVDRRFRALLAQASHGNQLPLAPQDGERLLEHMLRDDLAGGGAGV